MTIFNAGFGETGFAEQPFGADSQAALARTVSFDDGGRTVMVLNLDRTVVADQDQRKASV